MRNSTKKSDLSVWRKHPGVCLGFFSFTLAALAAAAWGFQLDTNRFIVVVHEAQMDLSSKGVTADDCLVVLGDGRIHLERKGQQLPQTKKQLTIFEGSLDSGQMQRLTEILNDKSIVELPSTVVPKLPLSALWFRAFSATISRPDGPQDVGYFVVPEQTIPQGASNYISDDTRRVWANSQSRLRSLVGWAHDVEGMKLTPSDVSSASCGIAVNEPSSSQ